MPVRPKELLISEAGPVVLAAAVERFGGARIRAFGCSMFPAIRSGDLLHIARIAPDTVLPGDVVVIRRDGRIFAHRVVSRSADTCGVVTRGDAHLHADPPASPHDIVGLVVAIERDGEYLRGPFHTSTFGRLRGLAMSAATTVWRRALRPAITAVRRGAASPARRQ
jgi:hypothetical protein